MELQETTNEEKRHQRHTKQLKSEKKKKSKKKEINEDYLNNVNSKKDILCKSDTENEERIQNDISDNPSKEKNTNIVKEKRKKKREDKDKTEQKKISKKSKEKNKKVEFDPNLTKQESPEVVGVFVHECEVLGMKTNFTLQKIFRNRVSFYIEMDFLVCHPVVKVSIVDGATGYLLQKSGNN